MSKHAVLIPNRYIMLYLDISAPLYEVSCCNDTEIIFLLQPQIQNQPSMAVRYTEP